LKKPYFGAGFALRSDRHDGCRPLCRWFRSLSPKRPGFWHVAPPGRGPAIGASFRRGKGSQSPSYVDPPGSARWAKSQTHATDSQLGHASLSSGGAMLRATGPRAEPSSGAQGAARRSSSANRKGPVFISLPRSCMLYCFPGGCHWYTSAARPQKTGGVFAEDARCQGGPKPDHGRAIPDGGGGSNQHIRPIRTARGAWKTTGKQDGRLSAGACRRRNSWSTLPELLGPGEGDWPYLRGGRRPGRTVRGQRWRWARNVSKQSCPRFEFSSVRVRLRPSVQGSVPARPQGTQCSARPGNRGAITEWDQHLEGHWDSWPGKNEGRRTGREKLANSNPFGPPNPTPTPNADPNQASQACPSAVGERSSLGAAFFSQLV